ncbi:hypothetical protein [Streptomyces sp. NPDC048565]|uniref:hypothetical protein n=1 Tax=Streptomyces sp. NPDC048565 TaxID=3155266 RepID=UPI00343B505E
MASVSLTLVAANGQDRQIGALSVTAPGTIIERAMDHGYSNVQALTLSVAIGKVHGLAVAEEAPRPGHRQLPAEAGLAGLPSARLLPAVRVLRDRPEPGLLLQGVWVHVHALGEGFLLERINLPFGIHAGPDQRVFTRWRPPR